MISKVTQSNKVSYEARIAQINKALEASGSSTRVTDFESYFGNISEIKRLATNFVGSASGDATSGTPGKFLLMPLDEPLFEIDANKRLINVPADFSKNGIGVRGDHMAETLYFKIDRYFDHQDLFNVDEIIINWQFRPANASRNAEIPMHTSLAFAPDEEYIPGCVVFGWVIDNEMTLSKGTLNFSVGFVKKEGDRYQYALNTMIASVNINDSLYLEDPTILASLKRPVFERLSDSRYTPDGIEAVKDPIWRTGEEDEDEEGNLVLRGLKSVMNFNLEADGTEQEKIVLEAAGSVPSQANVNIHYEWSGSSFATDTQFDSVTNNAYVSSNDLMSAVDGITYYVKDGDEYILLSNDSDPTKEEAFGENAADYPKYELGTSLEVVEGGRYMVSMQASRETTQSAGAPIISKSNPIESVTCIIPKAAVPKVELSATSAIAPTDPVLGYEIIDTELADKYVFVNDGAPGVKAKISIDKDKIDVSKGIIKGSSLGAIAFKLVPGGGAAPTMDEIQDMEAADAAAKENNEENYEKKFKPLTPTLEFDVPNSKASDEGDYQVYAINRRNHTYGISDISNAITVSKIAPKLTGISLFAIEDGEEDIKLIENNNTVRVTVGSKEENASVEIDGQHLARDFRIDVADSFDNIGSEGDKPSLVLQVLEIDSNAYDNNKTIKFPQDNPDGENDVPPVDQETRTFTIDRDPGTYIIRATVDYHGTRRITETQPFFVTSRLNFN